MTEIRFVDTTLRDGATSLWAARLTTSAMLPLLPDLDAAGYDAAEFFSSASKATRLVRERGENPWDWLRLGVPRAPHTALRMHGTGMSNYGWQPQAVRELYLELLSRYGLKTTRTSDSWNDVRELRKEQELLSRFGIRMVMNLIYSVSPRHTVEYYTERARAIATLKPYRMCFKDVAGLLTPERTRELMPIVLEAAGDTPVEFHAHSNNGLAPYNCLVAAQAGVRIIHTAIPPLANGSSQASVFNVAGNLQALGFTPAIDLEPLKRVRSHLLNVARIEQLPVGVPREFDQSVYGHQVPGGMISHLTFQLEKLGIADRLDATLAETARVRAEFGYPIMVTPLSQFVGSQAAVNVLTGERYATVTDEAIRYALGEFGREAVDVMDQDVRAKVLDRPRAREIAATSRPEPTIEEIRQKYGPISDEELVTRFYVGDDAASVFRSPSKRYPTSYEEYDAVNQPLVTLLGKVAADHSWRHLDLQQGETRITLRRR